MPVVMEIDEEIFNKTRGIVDIIINRSANADEGLAMATVVLMHMVANNSGIANEEQAAAVMAGISKFVASNFEYAKDKYVAAGVAAGSKTSSEKH